MTMTRNKQPATETSSTATFVLLLTRSVRGTTPSERNRIDADTTNYRCLACSRDFFFEAPSVGCWAITSVLEECKSFLLLSTSSVMPATTRRAAKRQRVAHGPLLGDHGGGGGADLPSCVLGRVLSFLNLADLVRMSACNSVLRQQVYQEHRQALWRCINFGALPYSVTSRITDRQLAVLLRNCNARDTCQVIKLLGCDKIRGAGLEPLRGSCWLREADLRLESSSLAGQTDLSRHVVDPRIVLPILASMPPMAQNAIALPANSGSLGLSLVKFHHERNGDNFYSQFEERVSDWLVSFHEALRAKATENQCKCGYCQGIIMNTCAEEDRAWVMDLSYCELCQKYTCPCGSCPADCPITSVCSYCLLQCCQTYGDRNVCPTQRMIFNCHTCNSHACTECFEGVFCSKCTNMFCQECFDGTFCANEECYNYSCREDECTDTFIACESCGLLLCPDCIAEHQQQSNCSIENID
jgi:hypothetical protein